jgi:crotonobetainyl-CoA:carnitine CoA-transferase CaiB-like acyl-CoA transferase
LKDKRYNDEEFRARQIDHIIAVLAEWTRTHTKTELFNLGQLMQFPWAPVQSPRDVVESPQLAARDFFQVVDQSENSAIKKCPRIPFKIAPGRASSIAPAPGIGADNFRVFIEELGLSREKLNDLASRGVI